jgi:NitT/TauT family transport system permease protein
MLREGYELFTVHWLPQGHRGDGLARVGGFVLAAALGVPLGIAMGAYKPIEAFLRAVRVVRALPAGIGVHPLLILWAGIGETQKLLVIFIGVFFQIVLMVAVIVGATRRELVEAAYTLGASASGIVRRVLLPNAAPQDRRDAAARARLGVDLRDRRRADRRVVGIGHMITDSQALLNTARSSSASS